MQILGIRDQSCTTGLGIAMLEGKQRRLITSLLVLVGGSSRTVTVSNRFEVLDALENLIELWDTFKWKLDLRHSPMHPKDALESA